ncbi:MAG TPA: AMP-binding protein [Micromonosporaceae bacterium]
MPSRDLPFVLSTLARRGVARPGRPDRIMGQIMALRAWGYTLAGELRGSAARFPDRIAIIDDEQSITYRRLVRRTDRLARAMKNSWGVLEGDRLGILCRNHGGMVEVMVAATALGADPVLINTGLSRPQLAAVAEQQQLRAICFDREFDPIVAGIPAMVARLPISGVDEMAASAPPGGLRRPRHDSRIIVLTSGTTGTPKGARRPIPPGMHPLASIISRIPLQAGERMFVSAPLFHTWGLSALQMAFALSGTVVLQRRFEPAATLRAIADSGSTALFVVPVMLQRLLEVPPVPTNLRVVASSGSALPGDLATKFMDTYGDVLYNLYGSTEASWASIATPSELRRNPHTAGRPPHGTRVAILDPDGRPVPTGQVGQIYVGNTMLFDGYTSETMHELRDGLMATGDLGHLDQSGLLFVDGRADDMIVSGGENVFPSEVENLLAQLPQVREVAVVGVPDEEFGQRLAAYIVLRPHERLDADSVREYVRHYLARFSVPRDVVFLHQLPRNATGKVVPRELPSPGPRR